MARFTSNILVAVVLGQVVAQLGWIDPLFLVLVVVAPPVSGAFAAANRVGYPWIAALWCSVGVGMAWSDWVVNHEDVAFHLGTAVVMPLLAGAGYGAVRLATRGRRSRLA